MKIFLKIFRLQRQKKLINIPFTETKKTDYNSSQPTLARYILSKLLTVTSRSTRCVSRRRTGIPTACIHTRVKALCASIARTRRIRTPFPPESGRLFADTRDKCSRRSPRVSHLTIADKRGSAERTRERANARSKQRDAFIQQDATRRTVEDRK